MAQEKYRSKQVRSGKAPKYSAIRSKGPVGTSRASHMVRTQKIKKKKKVDGRSSATERRQMAKLGPGQKKRVPLHKDYAKGLKSLGKKALKATPPGMMFTAAQLLKKEFGRLTKPKKRPEAKTGPRTTKKKPKAVPGGPFKPENKKNPVPGGPYKPKKGPKYKPMKKKKK